MVIDAKTKNKTVMLFGTFDIFHQGHAHLFKQARSYGDYLIAVVARDQTVLKLKGKPVRNNEATRLALIRQSELADQTVLGDLTDKFKAIRKYRPVVICLGYDQRYFTKNLRSALNRLGLKETEIIRLKPYRQHIYKSANFKHLTVGAIIKKGRRLLLIKRAYFPPGWAGPAGHINRNETPLQALKREVREETNLKIVSARLLAHQYIGWNKCVKGISGHYWYLYEVGVGERQGRFKPDPGETEAGGWFRPEQAAKLKLEKVWRYWLKKLGIL
jgi:FAD synthetase